MTNQVKLPYQPDLVSPPGETLLDLLEEQEMSQTELAKRMGRPVKTINEIAQGKAALTPDTALQLEKVFGTPARFWLNREQAYREFLARQLDAIKLNDWVDWIKKFPVADMRKKGLISATRKPQEIVVELLQFFCIANPDAWKDVCAVDFASFRQAGQYQPDAYALSVWLRQGELQASEIDSLPYDKQAFRELLQTELRTFTLQTPSEFAEKLIEVCAGVGVAVVYVSQTQGTHVSGAARWLTKDKALIQLSLRYKRNDQFWFSFFHEAAHILLHGKKETFIDTGEDAEKHDEKEAEANKYAADTLIPPAEYKTFVAKIKPGRYPSRVAVERFSNQLGIAPAIVVGRLQRDRHLEYRHLNGLKQKFEWVAE
jgi:HTH-type transcriptional regulator/antitoxin HigA